MQEKEKKQNNHENKSQEVGLGVNKKLCLVKCFWKYIKASLWGVELSNQNEKGKGNRTPKLNQQKKLTTDKTNFFFFVFVDGHPQLFCTVARKTYKKSWMQIS